MFPALICDILLPQMMGNLLSIQNHMVKEG